MLFLSFYYSILSVEQSSNGMNFYQHTTIVLCRLKNKNKNYFLTKLTSYYITLYYFNKKLLLMKNFIIFLWTL